MNYTIKSSRSMLGDVVSLVRVAEAMARKKTLGGGAIQWHQPTFDAVKLRYESMLVNAAAKGSLKVCDQYGDVKSINEIVNADRGAQLNPDTAEIYSLYAKEHHLNQWGASNGDTFSIEDTGVEATELPSGGHVLLESPTSRMQTVEKVATLSDPNAVATKQPNWRHLVQAEAWDYFLKLRASGCNPSVNSICDRMAIWCSQNGIKGDKGQDPKSGTIRNSVLGGGNWTQPTHSVEQAKKYVAQIAQTEVAQTAQ